jgi:hypothetical protein
LAAIQRRNIVESIKSRWAFGQDIGWKALLYCRGYRRESVHVILEDIYVVFQLWWAEEADENQLVWTPILEAPWS